ncbi:MAG: von Willebrand factor type A domain-containing protein [Planctomycetaceae bacterium]
MSPDPTHDHLPEDDAAKITAHALGQLEDRERAEFLARLLRPDAEAARRIVDETRRIAEALHAERADSLHSPEAPGRSQDLRRTIIARLAAPSPAPKAKPPAPQARRHHAPWGLLAMAGSLAAAVIVAATVLFDAPRAERQVALRKAPAAKPAAADKSTMATAEPTAKRASEKEALAVDVDMVDMVELSDVPAPAADMRSAGKARAETESRAEPAARALAAPDRRALAAARAPAPGGLAARSARVIDESAREADRSFDGVPREGYERLEENRKRAVSDEPLSTFSIDVDTASYANVRRFLSSGRLPPRDAVRIEELVNYFRYDDPKPAGDDPFSVAVESAASPWHAGRLIVRIGLKGREIDRARRPAGNIVFLIDVSGSMQQPDKLPLVKQAVAMLVEELTENDRVSIVTYAGDAGLVLPPTTGDQKQQILAAIERLRAGGSTHGSAGLELAYEQAAEHFIEGGVNRVILATDGDLNVGVTSDDALVELIKRKAAGGTFLTVLGFGQGNLQDAKMEKIADNGNGIYAYIDGAREARKVLVEQLTGSTITIAKDVKIQVEFNPATVASYRLIGYENRLLAARDFRDDRKDAGEIGAGHSVTALYEIVPLGGVVGDIAGSGAEPLRYQPQPETAAAEAPTAAKAAAIDPAVRRELLTVKLRFKKPDGQESVLREFPLADRGGEFDAASADLRFATAVAAFGMILRGSDEAGSATLADVARIAGRAIGRDDGGYRAEFLDLVRKARSLRDTAAP